MRVPRSTTSPQTLLGIFGFLLGLILLGAACSDDQLDPPTASEQQGQTADQIANQPDPSQDSQPPSTSQQAQRQSQQAQPSDDDRQAAPQQQNTNQSISPEPASTQQQQDATPQPPTESVPEDTRLIALFGDITEIVYALDADEFLVARDTSSVYPPEAESLPNLGFAGALNAEAILSYEPTLIIGSPLAGPPGVIEQLRETGVELLLFDELNGLDAPAIKIRIIGEALGIPQRAEALALDVEKRMADVVAGGASIKQPLKVLHVYIRRGGLQLVSGEGNGAQTIIEAAGGIDAGAEAGIVGWQPLTPEALVAADPDAYLVMDLGLGVIGGVEGLLAIPGMAETKAGRNQQIISMPDLLLLGFGPRLPQAITDLTAYLEDIQNAAPSDQQHNEQDQ